MKFKEGDSVIRIRNPNTTGSRANLEIGSVWIIEGISKGGNLTLKDDPIPGTRNPNYFKLVKYPDDKEITQAYETLKTWIG